MTRAAIHSRAEHGLKAVGLGCTPHQLLGAQAQAAGDGSADVQGVLQRRLHCGHVLGVQAALWPAWQDKRIRVVQPAELVSTTQGCALAWLHALQANR